MRLLSVFLTLIMLSPVFADETPQSASTLTAIDLPDFRGRRWVLNDFADDSLLVVAFMGTECPLAKLYALRLNEIADEYQSRSVKVVGVMSNRQDSLEEIAAFASRQKLAFPLLKDAGNRFADRLDAERTPEIFVFDAAAPAPLPRPRR